MMTSSQSQESPEYHIFQAHYDKLWYAIQDPLPLTIQLFSQGIINSAVKDRMTVYALSRLEKNNTSLSAVEVQIQTDPNKFYLFLSVLKKDPSLQSLVESMEGKCLSCKTK